MKKLIALLLCLMMVVSVFAGCQETNPAGSSDPAVQDTTPDTTPNTPDVDPTLPPVADAEEIPYTPIYKLTFDDSTNLTAKIQDRCKDEDGDGVCDLGDKCTATTKPDGASYGMVDYSGNILFSNGPVGQCVYLDGNYGLKLENLVAPTDDSYTISFWVNASRLSDFMPSLQIGRNIGCAGDDETVSWINVTQTNFFGTGASFPSIWNRNSSVGPDTDGDGVPNGVWPWINKLDDTVYGKNEWIMVTIVATGELYEHVDAETGLAEPRIGCHMYINGVEVMNGTATGVTPLDAASTYHGLSPEILLGDGLEGYLGINFWDYTMKGYFDELYIYDEVLTAGQIATLWAEGDATVETETPTDAPVNQDPTAPVDPAAIDVAGTPDMMTGWWSDWTKSWEIADGQTVTVQLNNYSLGAANWNNYCTVFANVATPGHVAPSNTEGYAEYAVVRADLFGWGDASYAMTTAECNWLVSDNVDADWAAWCASMTDADVTLVITRNGSEITLEATQVCADGNTFNSKIVVATSLTAEAPCHFFFVTDTDYVEVLSVE